MSGTIGRKLFWELKLCPLYRGCPFFKVSTMGDYTVYYCYPVFPPD